MTEEFLTCPRCQAKLRADEMVDLPPDTILECTVCQEHFTLSRGRLIWSRPVFPPRDFRPPYPRPMPRRIDVHVQRSIASPKKPIVLSAALLCVSCLVVFAINMPTRTKTAEDAVATAGLNDAKIAAERAIRSALRFRRPAEVKITVARQGSKTYTAEGTVAVKNVLGVYLTENVSVSLYRESEQGARGMRMAMITLSGEVVKLDRDAIRKVKADVSPTEEVPAVQSLASAAPALPAVAALPEASAPSNVSSVPDGKINVVDVVQEITPLGATELVLTAENTTDKPISYLAVDVTFTHQRQKVSSGRVPLRFNPPIEPQSTRALRYRVPFGSDLRAELPKECVGAAVVVSAD